MTQSSGARRAAASTMLSARSPPVASAAAGACKRFRRCCSRRKGRRATHERREFAALHVECTSFACRPTRRRSLGGCRGSHLNWLEKDRVLYSVYRVKLHLHIFSRRHIKTPPRVESRAHPAVATCATRFPICVCTRIRRGPPLQHQSTQATADDRRVRRTRNAMASGT